MYPNSPGFYAGSGTSQAAAESIESCAETMRARIRDFIKNNIRAACFQVEIALELSNKSASARLRELVLLGRIYDTGDRTPNERGILCRLYAICDEGPSDESLRPPNRYVGHSTEATRDTIANVVRLLGDATYDEVVSATGLLSQTVTPAIADMILLGTLIDSGLKRKTRANRFARILRLPETGFEYDIFGL